MELKFTLLSVKLGERADRWPTFATVRVQPADKPAGALLETRFIEITFKLAPLQAPAGLGEIEAAALRSARELVQPAAAALLLAAMSG